MGAKANVSQFGERIGNCFADIFSAKEHKIPHVHHFQDPFFRKIPSILTGSKIEQDKARGCELPLATTADSSDARILRRI